MKSRLAHRLQLSSLVILIFCAWQPKAQADPIPVRYTRGTIHGLLEMRSEDGHIIASGDLVQVVRGSQAWPRGPGPLITPPSPPPRWPPT